MALILGIDTGGTYTDAVIVESESKKIIKKAKALTTVNSLSEGIRNCIELLNIDAAEKISLVSLSTTLATNAVVEGKGGRAGLIYFGNDIEEIPEALTKRVQGRMDIKGNILEDIDENEIRQTLADFNGNIDALAISGYASVRNPSMEMKICTLAEEMLNIPVVCAHQLTSALGYQHRTVTAVLNGKLIPLIDRLIKAVRVVLDENDIRAPLMIVKGDGTIMTEEVAKSRPVETILSGPAASVIGALCLTNETDGLVLDMGGTTTDIADFTGRNVQVKQEGACVGGWNTRVKSVEISTFGIGGDSVIYLDKKGNINIGPEKVIPLCVAGYDHPELIYEMRSFRRAGDIKKYSSTEADCYMCIGSSDGYNLTDIEKQALEAASDRPHSITHIASEVGKDPEVLDLTNLVKKGMLARVSLTPTDLLHCNGQYLNWNSEMSMAGVRILADRMGITPKKFIEKAIGIINEKLALACLQSIENFEEAENSSILINNENKDFFIERAFGRRPRSTARITIGLNKPVIAIGAPAEAWVKNIAALMDVKVIIPENADVANAYGAAVGQLTEKIELLISAVKGRFVLNLPWKKEVYESRDEALFYAIHEGRKAIEHRLRDAGCARWEISECTEDKYLEVKDGDNMKYSGTRMVITGVGHLI